jgi:myosin heavy subunit
MVEELQEKVTNYQSKCEQQASELNSMKTKYDEMYIYCTNTEKVVNERVHMKEQEVIRLKKILFGKEDIIRKVSIAYEQAKNNLESYVDEIEYLKQRLATHEGDEGSQIILDNESLRSQNKQLLNMLMSHLTNIDKKQESSKSKNKKLGNTVKVINASMKGRSKQKIKPTSKRRCSAKRKSKRAKAGRARALTSDRYFNNMNQLQDYRNMSSLTPLNKNLINIQNNMNNNYQSFDNTLDKVQMTNHMATNLQNNPNRSVMHPHNYNPAFNNSTSTDDNKENHTSYIDHNQTDILNQRQHLGGFINNDVNGNQEYEGKSF